MGEGERGGLTQTAVPASAEMTAKARGLWLAAPDELDPSARSRRAAPPQPAGELVCGAIWRQRKINTETREEPKLSTESLVFWILCPALIPVGGSRSVI